MHFPTDINLLYDAMRKAIGFSGEECRRLDVSAWRQYKHNIKQLKRLMRKAEKTKRPTYKDEKRQVSQVKKVQCTHKSYIEQAEIFLEKISETESDLQHQGLYDPIRWIGVDKLINHAKRQIDQIRRRVFCGEIIPHEEKVFSIFEEHTEWISKGKKKAPVELGLQYMYTHPETRAALFKVLERVIPSNIDQSTGRPAWRYGKYL